MSQRPTAIHGQGFAHMDIESALTFKLIESYMQFEIICSELESNSLVKVNN